MRRMVSQLHWPHMTNNRPGPGDPTVDRNRTLTELEGRDWGAPAYSSHLVTTCHRLRHKPLLDFTAEDLRIMIGQNISLELLVPLAIERLELDPLAEGDF